CHPLAISRLYKKRLAHAVRPRYHLGSSHQAHSESSFIKVVDIFICNSVL
ncbi:hypothetical protein ASPACDRAFT_37791, partial [Aspergillus aculeatus ATCC 16872]